MTDEDFKRIIRASNVIKKLDKRRRRVKARDVAPGDLVGWKTDGSDMGLCVWSVIEENATCDDVSVQNLGIVINSCLKQEAVRAHSMLYVYT